MKISIVLIFIFIRLLINAQDYTIDDKTVFGDDKTEVELDIELDEQIDERQAKESYALQINDEQIELLPESEISEVRLERYIEDGDEHSISYNIIIQPERIVQAEKQTVIDDTAEEIVRVVDSSSSSELRNHFIFSIGGYERVDAFQYIIDYRDQISKGVLDYYLHLGRDISGEDRENTKISIDNYFGKLWYENFDISMSHIIKDNIYPGKIDVDNVSSTKNMKKTNTLIGYSTKLGENQDLRLNLRYRKNNVESSVKEREYNNTFIMFNGIYERFLKLATIENTINFQVKYSNDQLELKNKDQTLINISASNKMNIRNMNLELNGALGLETVNRNNEAGKTNTRLILNGTKDIKNDSSIGFGIEKNSLVDNYDYLLRSFGEYDDIILNPDIESEEIIKYYINYDINIMEYIYILGKYSYLSSEDKISYKQKDIDGGNETALEIINNNKKIGWSEFLLNVGYNNQSISGEATYNFSGAFDRNLTFNPAHAFTLEIFYRDESYTGCGVYNLVSEQYVDDNDKIDGYSTLDILNNYRFTNSISGNFNIMNILDNESEYLKNYPRRGRKLTCQIEVKY